MAGSLLVLIPALAGLSILGAYCGPIMISSNGFGDASWMYFIQPISPAAVGFPGAPKPTFRDYTGVEALDGALCALVAYFSALFDGDVAPQYNLFSYWAFFQFMPLSVLVVLEGLRAGNRGTIASWTSTMLFFAQFMSWQFLIPLWVILYLLTSPIAKAHPSTPRSGLLVDLWNLAVLPLTVFLTFVLPTIAIFLPPSMISAKGHYASIAFWQPFPLWNYILHTALSTLGRTFYGPLNGSPGAGGPSAYLARVQGVYELVFLAGALGQLPIVFLALAPSSLLSALVDTFPWLQSYVASQVSLASVFAPQSFLAGLTIDPTAIGSGDLAPLAVYFLHYDMYIGCGALLLWAVYLHRTAVKSCSAGGLLIKVTCWFSVGGFSAAVAALLRERDLYVLESENSVKKTA